MAKSKVTSIQDSTNEHFVIDIEALFKVIPKEDIEQLVQMLNSKEVNDKKMAWGMIFGRENLTVDEKDNLVMHLFNVLEKTEYVEIINAYNSTRKEWEEKI